MIELRFFFLFVFYSASCPPPLFPNESTYSQGMESVKGNCALHLKSQRRFWRGNKDGKGWTHSLFGGGKGSNTGELLFSFATTCICLRVMVIHQLPRGTEIMRGATVNGVAEKSQRCSQWLTTAIKEWKNLQSIPFCPPLIPHRENPGKKKRET